MRIGILGSGLMGGKLGTIFARAGHDVVFSYARSPNKLERLARDAGGKARAGSPREAAQQAEAVLVAVHWSRVDDVLQQAGNLSGDEGKAKQVAATPIRDAGFDPVDAGALRIARYTEPFALLVGELAYGRDGGPELAYRFERFRC